MTMSEKDIGGLRTSKMPMERVLKNMEELELEPYWCPFLPVNAECTFTKLSVKPCDRCLQAQIRFELNRIRKEISALRASIH